MISVYYGIISQNKMMGFQKADIDQEIRLINKNFAIYFITDRNSAKILSINALNIN